MKKITVPLVTGAAAGLGTAVRVFADEAETAAESAAEAESEAAAEAASPTLWSQIAQNAGFIGIALAVAVALIVLAGLLEKFFCKDTKQVSPAFRVTLTAMLSALALVLMLLEFPVPFAPGFYKLDFSEVPILFVGFFLGPVAGVTSELIKNVLEVLIRGTSTAFVGEFANFVVGCSLVLPATVIYWRKRTKKSALIGCVVGTVVIAVVGSTFNAVYLLPAFSKLYGIPMDTLIGMGTAIFRSVKGVWSFVIFCVAPLNLLKGAMVSLIVMLIYKPISRAITPLIRKK